MPYAENTCKDESLKYSYSLAYVNAYAVAMKDKTEINALTNAMFAYGTAAEAYIAE